MQGQQSGGKPHYRCRYPKKYALANHTQHPDNVYLKEENLLPVLDTWLAKLFAPHRIGETIRAMAEQARTETSQKAEPQSDVTKKVAACDAKLETYRAALEAGADPVTVSGWIADVKAERAAVLATASAQRTRTNPDAQTSEESIKNMIQALGDVGAAIQRAGREEKARLYSELDLRLTYAPGTKTIRVEMNLDPDIHGVTACVRGPTQSLDTCHIGTIIGRISLDQPAAMTTITSNS